MIMMMIFSHHPMSNQGRVPFVDKRVTESCGVLKLPNMEHHLSKTRMLRYGNCYAKTYLMETDMRWNPGLSMTEDLSSMKSLQRAK
jgi:hypothetical protein